jgi:hypothetical protein
MTFLFAAGGAALGMAGVGGLTLATGAGLGLGLGSALNSSRASGQAASTQAAAADRTAALQKQMFDQQMAGQEPYRQAGLTGQNRLMELLGLGGTSGAEGYGKYAKDFSMADYQADPGYAFRLSEGQKALERSAAARGGLISGGALKAATRYGQDMGSQEYQNAFNRYQTNRSNQLQPLGNLMSMGQSAASNQGTAAGNYGTNAGQSYMAGGQATAAGQLGAANSLASGLQGTVSAYQNQNNFNNWLKQNQTPQSSPITQSGPINMPGYDVNYFDGTYQGR